MGLSYDPHSPQKCLFVVLPLSAFSLKIFGFPVIVIALVGVERLYENLLVMRMLKLDKIVV